MYFKSYLCSETQLKPLLSKLFCMFFLEGMFLSCVLLIIYLPVYHMRLETVSLGHPYIQQSIIKSSINIKSQNFQDRGIQRRGTLSKSQKDLRLPKSPKGESPWKGLSSVVRCIQSIYRDLAERPQGK